MFEKLFSHSSPRKRPDYKVLDGLYEGERKRSLSRLGRNFQDRFQKTLGPLLHEFRLKGEITDAEAYLLLIFLTSQVLLQELEQMVGASHLDQRGAQQAPVSAARPQRLTDESYTRLTRAIRGLVAPLIRIGHPYPEIVAVTVLSTASAVEESHRPKSNFSL